MNKIISELKDELEIKSFFDKYGGDNDENLGNLYIALEKHKNSLVKKSKSLIQICEEMRSIIDDLMEEVGELQFCEAGWNFSNSLLKRIELIDRND